MKKLALILVMLLVMESFTFGQIDSIKIKDVNVNDNQIQILVENNFNQDFVKELFVINGNNETLQEVELKAFEAKFFIISYDTEIKLETLQIIVDDNTANYRFTGQEDTFVINQETSQTTELTQVESNSPISYIYSAGRVAKIQDNNVIYFQSDNVGSTSLETDNIGNVNFKANYLPFGKELSFSSINNERYGFTGKEYDAESSLNYFNARYYNPSNGKFISNDPVFKPTEGGYQYVINNPLIITDPSGMQDETSFGKPTFESDSGYNSESRIRFNRDYGKKANYDMSIPVDFSSVLSDDGEVDLPLDIAPSRVITLEMITKESVKKKYGPLVARRGGYRKITPKALKHINQKFFSEGNLAVVPPEYYIGPGVPLANVETLEHLISFIEGEIIPLGYKAKIVYGLRTAREQERVSNLDPDLSAHYNGGRGIDVSFYDDKGNLINLRTRRLRGKALELNRVLEERLPDYGLWRPWWIEKHKPGSRDRRPKERNHIELED
ncbi:MAG TPA: RHS repeat-associated core domain-containing protein [Candidatus Nanoarchaeia archaeon]|nr:RHS repeat-associated core domain-containing protein [Candidatus Nanoarchaeia archaeon]